MQKRRDFLVNTGLATLSPLIPFKSLFAVPDGALQVTDCTLIPSETRGPFPLFDASAVSSQTALIRSDIKESQTGVPLALTVTVQNAQCVPIPNAKVYIWQCTKAGVYSGYNTNENPGQAGTTYLRGIQTTNAAGQVTFSTIYPGWYNGRLTHIHFEVYINNVLMRTSQIAFPLDSVSGSPTALVNASYGRTNNTITSYSGDNVFNDGITQQLITLTGSVSAGYVGTNTFTLDYTVLPLHLLSFKAGTDGGKPTLWWTTTDEVDLDHFEIEQSNHPSRNFTAIGTQRATNLPGTHTYAFTLPEAVPTPVGFYRLKMVDKNGSFVYSGVVTINADQVDKIKLVNTLVTSELIIKHPVLFEKSVVKIIDSQGRMMATGQLTTGATATRMQAGFLKDGVYFLVIENGIDRLSTRFVKRSQ